jgi:hypothetical protein
LLQSASKRERRPPRRLTVLQAATTGLMPEYCTLLDAFVEGLSSTMS